MSMQSPNISAGECSEGSVNLLASLEKNIIEGHRVQFCCHILQLHYQSEKRSEGSYKRGKLNTGKLKKLQLFFFLRRVILNMTIMRMYLIWREDFCK